MTLAYLRAVAAYCDRKFEFRPGAETFDLHLQDIRNSLLLKDRVIGTTGEFCSFLFWQLRRNGYSPIIFHVRDFNGHGFFVIGLYDYLVSYYDGKIYLNHECPWKVEKQSEDLKEWTDVNDNTFGSAICTTKHPGCYDYT